MNDETDLDRRLRADLEPTPEAVARVVAGARAGRPSRHLAASLAWAAAVLLALGLPLLRLESSRRETATLNITNSGDLVLVTRAGHHAILGGAAADPARAPQSLVLVRPGATP